MNIIENKYMIKLVDGGIMDIKINSSTEDGGCPTCGYGAIYSKDILIIFEHLPDLYMEFTYYDEDECKVSMSYLIGFFCSNATNYQKMTEKECYNLIKNTLKPNSSDNQKE